MMTSTACRVPWVISASNARHSVTSPAILESCVCSNSGATFRRAAGKSLSVGSESEWSSCLHSSPSLMPDALRPGRPVIPRSAIPAPNAGWRTAPNRRRRSFRLRFTCSFMYVSTCGTAPAPLGKERPEQLFQRERYRSRIQCRCVFHGVPLLSNRRGGMISACRVPKTHPIIRDIPHQTPVFFFYVFGSVTARDRV